MSLPDRNPQIPEGINASEDNPLVEFAWLAGGVLLGLAGLVFVLSLAIRYLAPLIPFSWEQRASGAVDIYVETQDPESDFAAAAQVLAGLGEALLVTSMTVPLPDGEDVDAVPVAAYRFHFLDEEAPNAFATLGANVLVTEGLLDEVQSENGLAMVIAHEIAHVQLRHPVESLSRGLVIQLVMAAVLGTTDGNALGGALGSGGVLTMLSFSRDMELQADARALQILRAHYGHVTGADEFFRSMADDHDSAAWQEFVSTHPDTDKRIALIESALSRQVGSFARRDMPVELRDYAALERGEQCVPDCQSEL